MGELAHLIAQFGYEVESGPLDILHVFLPGSETVGAKIGPHNGSLVVTVYDPEEDKYTCRGGVPATKYVGGEPYSKAASEVLPELERVLREHLPLPASA